MQLGECQSKEFDAQIAATMLGMLQYNLLAVARRFSAYQTSGEPFRAIEKEIFQLTVREHIRQIIISIVAEIAQMMYENQILAKIINLKPILQAGQGACESRVCYKTCFFGLIMSVKIANLQRFFCKKQTLLLKHANYYFINIY